MTALFHFSLSLSLVLAHLASGPVVFAAVKTLPEGTLSAALSVKAAGAAVKPSNVVRPAQIEEYFRVYGNEPGKREILLEKLTLLQDKFPNNPYVYSALSVAARPGKPLLYALEQAKLAQRHAGGLRREERSLLTSNLASLSQTNGEKERAYKLYEEAIGLDGANWRAHLGLAQVASVDGSDGRVLALKELQLVRDNREVGCERLLALGKTYYALEMYHPAKVALLEALRLAQAASSSVTAECLGAIKIWLLKSCIEEKNQKIAEFRRLSKNAGHIGMSAVRQTGTQATSAAAIETDMGSGHENEFDPNLLELINESLHATYIDPELAIFLARGALSNEQLELLWSKVSERFIGEGKFYYELARLMETGRKPRLDLAEAGYRQAIAWNNGGLENLSLAANLSRQGKTEELRKLLTETTFTLKDNFRTAFEKVSRNFQEKGENFQNLFLYRGVLKNLKCGCRLSIVEYKLETSKGIIFARLDDKKEPPVTLFFNSDLIPAAQLASALQGVAKEQEKFELTAIEPLKGLVDLVEHMQKLEDSRKRKSFNMWSFVPPPLKLL